MLGLNLEGTGKYMAKVGRVPGTVVVGLEWDSRETGVLNWQVMWSVLVRAVTHLS